MFYWMVHKRSRRSRFRIKSWWLFLLFRRRISCSFPPSISPDANAEGDETDDDGFAALDDAKAIRVVFLSLVFVCLFGERDVLSSIPKPYTLNKKDAKNGKQLSFTQNTQEKFLFCVFVCVSLLPFSLSLSLSLPKSLEVWKQTLLLKRRNWGFFFKRDLSSGFVITNFSVKGGLLYWKFP